MPLTTFLVKKAFSLHRPVLIFQPTVNLKASNSQSSSDTTVYSAGKNAQLLSVDVYIGVCGGV
jgi:hypothetical protein